MTRYFDAHCHISNAVNADEILRQNSEFQIAGHICNAACFDDWGAVIAAGAVPTVFSCIGIHPWYVASAPSDWAANMREILRANPTVMVGEAGLDKFHADMGRQIEFFIEQLNIAVEFGRAMHIHCVGAWDKIAHIFSGHKMPPVVVAHGFSGGEQFMTQLALKYNIYFSYGPAILDIRRAKLRACVAATPKNRILVESDDDISATPRIAATVRGISDICGMDMADVIYNNTIGVINNGTSEQNSHVNG